MLGYAYYKTGEIEKAIYYLQIAFGLFEKIDEKKATYIMEFINYIKAIPEKSENVLNDPF